MAQMTFWQFAGEHPALAVFFVVLAASVAVVLGGLFIAWRVSRPVKYTAADRAALNETAMWLRVLCETNMLDGRKALSIAERLEGMAR